ncbi:serine O-acetyltransferase [Qipengyuania sp. DSG2-2]|uniref:serine O-acetyltransferase n=1 Tax=Qipengyuania sp. DGS2-2 TaxID=3349631 RepID=UPI0036D23168
MSDGKAKTARLSLRSLLKSDLERYWHYYGRPGTTPRTWNLWRNFLIPRCAPVALYRLAHSAHRRGLRPIAKLITWLNFYLYGCEFLSECEIGPHFFMPHSQGSVIGALKIGSYAVIYHQVTIGAKSIDPGNGERPVIGDRCFIASGAKIVGVLTLGDDVTVGANAVVTKSAGSQVALMGIPATEKPKALPQD